MSLLQVGTAQRVSQVTSTCPTPARRVTTNVYFIDFIRQSFMAIGKSENNPLALKFYTIYFATALDTIDCLLFCV